MRLAGGLMGSRFGDDTAAVFEVRGEHAVVSGEMGAGTWHRASSLRERHFRGAEAGDEVHRVEHDMSGPVMEGVLESIHDLPAVIDREAFVRECWAGDVAAQAFEGGPLMGSAARAGMEGESRELSDAGVGRQEIYASFGLTYENNSKMWVIERLTGGILSIAVMNSYVSTMLAIPGFNASRSRSVFRHPSWSRSRDAPQERVLVRPRTVEVSADTGICRK